MDAAKVSTLDHQSPERDVTASQVELPTAVDVIRRMKEVAGLKADMHLAAELGTTRANIAKWKSRNSIPYAEALTISTRYGGSLDYILLGIDPIPYLKDRVDFHEETQLIRKILLDHADRKILVKEPKSSLDLDSQVQIMANIITFQHSKLLLLTSRIQRSTHVSRREAIRLALAEMGYGENTPMGPQ